MKLTIGNKIGLAFGLATLLFCLGGGMTYLANSKQLAALEQLQQTYDLFSQLHDVQSDIAAMVSVGRAYLLTGTESQLQLFHKIEQRLGEKIKQLRQQHAQRQVLAFLTAVEAKLHDIKQEMQRFFQVKDRAGQESLGSLVQQETSQRLLSEIEQLHDALEEEEMRKMQQQDQEAHRQVSLTNALILIGVPGMAVVLALMAWFITRNLVKPIQAMAKTSAAMANGDLNFSFQVHDRADEIGILEANFARLIDYQREMAKVADQLSLGNVSTDVHPRSDQDLLGHASDRAIRYQREMAELAHQISQGNLAVTVTPRSEADILGQAMQRMVTNMRQHLREVNDGVSALATAVSEITATASQIAAGATQTASAVTETTATIEELRQTIHLTSQKAREVSENSQATAQVSLDGKKAVEATIDGMNRIRRQMDSIAESIVKLSEQSQAIGHIIATVNDMADQSNLLAVNASIEAAKAGEQGKGFAVVAQEVRNLAEQSKQATAQVRSILNDIQKAISSAVMATEQGGKVVELGVQQSTEAGGSIQSLAASVSSSAQASVQIVAATNEQLVGMDQVAQAMESIKQASDQNVLGVRQVETAILNLNTLGHNLKEMVGHYQI
ncbi:MAG: methyl-accepting chemotaxis protein [Desulfobacca sp.]|uniref:methyl-accepting chemotaxis protein n=1 Tax=Desulfobacca sp. TaxID=2067990 RepID=UPI004049F7BF